MNGYWERKAERIERRRELLAMSVCIAVYALLISATVWAICALVSSLRENARLEEEAAHAHYVRVFFEGGRS